MVTIFIYLLWPVIPPLWRIWEKLLPKFFNHPSLACHEPRESLKYHTPSWALQSDCQCIQCTSTYLLPSEQSNHIWTLKKLHTMAPCWSRTHQSNFNQISIKFQSNFIRNTHKIKQLRLQYIQMVIHNYCIIGNKRGLLLKSLCCWGWTSQVICLLTSLYSLSYLRMGPAAPIKRFPPSEAPPGLWHWTRSYHMHLTVSTNSEKKKLLDYPTLNSTCRWCCWHFCHQSIHQLIEFTSTRQHKRLHNNMVKVKTLPVPQPKQNKRQQESVQSWPCECQSQVTTKE